MRGMMRHGHDGEYAHHQSKTAQTIDNARESAVTGK